MSAKGSCQSIEKIAKQDKGEILSGTLSEKERKTLERLFAEAGDVSEEVRVRLREIEDAEKKLTEMKR